MELKQEIKNELLQELGTIDEVAFNDAYFNARGLNKDEVKAQVKSILIQLLEKNANAPHKTKGGKFGAFMSNVGAILLNIVNLNKKK